MYLYNTKDISNGSFVIGDTQYPPNWLQFSTPEERAALGIVWAADPVPAPKTLAEVKAEALSEVLRLRDSILVEYSKRLIIYKPNFDAAMAIYQGIGDTFLMPNGQTATSFATAAAAEMNKTTIEWSAYIRERWQTLGTGVAIMENAYLRNTYHETAGINAMTTIEQVNTALAAFRTMTGQ